MLQPTNRWYRLPGCALSRPFRLGLAYQRSLIFPSSNFLVSPQHLHQHPVPPILGPVAKLVSTPCITERFASLSTARSDGHLHFGNYRSSPSRISFLASISRHWRSPCYFKDGYGKRIAFEIHHIDYAGLTAVWHQIPCTIAAFWMG